jgi:predicted phosphoribosyltransferase
MFRDRKDAGRQLAAALNSYKDQNPLVLAIPRGGVQVGFYVAAHLEADLSLLVARKLPFPDNPEAGFGAIAEDGSTFLTDYAERYLSSETVNAIVKEQSREISRRIKVLRKGHPLPPIAERTVILVDDGIAMGSTMQAAIMLCKNQKAEKIIVGSPVASPSTAAGLAKIVDDVAILEKPISFHAVAQVYSNWYDAGDEEVVRIMENWKQHKS